MATGHWLTNKGKQYLLQGKFETGSGTTINCLLLKGTQPASMDTAGEVADLNFVSDLLASTATECNFTNYVRKTITRVNATEDDTNDRSALDANDITWTAAGGTTNNTVIGFAWFDNAGGADTARILLGVDWFATPLATNGGDLTYTITDLVRAV